MGPALSAALIPRVAHASLFRKFRDQVSQVSQSAIRLRSRIVGLQSHFLPHWDRETVWAVYFVPQHLKGSTDEDLEYVLSSLQL